MLSICVREDKPLLHSCDRFGKAMTCLWSVMEGLCVLSICAALFREQLEIQTSYRSMLIALSLLILFLVRWTLPQYGRLISTVDGSIKVAVGGAVAGGFCFLCDMQDDIGYIAFISKPNYLYYLELLNCPLVVLSTIMCVYKMCERNVCSHKISAVITGVLIFEVCLIIILGLVGKIHSPFSIHQLRNAVAICIIIFLLAMFLCTPVEQMDVLITWIAIYCNLIWQTTYLDRSAWNSSLNRFPVPGGLSVFIWMCLRGANKSLVRDKHPGHLSQHLGDPGKQTNCLQNIIHKHFHCVKFHHGRAVFVGVYTLTRLALPWLFSAVRYSESEKWLNIIIVFVVFNCDSGELTGNKPSRKHSLWNVFAVLWIIAFYFCQSFATRHPTNVHLYDTVLGICLNLVTKKLDHGGFHERTPSDIEKIEIQMCNNNNSKNREFKTDVS